MKTIVYTYKDGILFCNGEVKALKSNLRIILYCYDELINKRNLFDLLGVEGEVEVFASYNYTLEGADEKASYYTYEIY